MHRDEIHGVNSNREARQMHRQVMLPNTSPNVRVCIVVGEGGAGTDFPSPGGGDRLSRALSVCVCVCVCVCVEGRVRGQMCQGRGVNDFGAMTVNLIPMDHWTPCWIEQDVVAACTSN